MTCTTGYIFLEIFSERPKWLSRIPLLLRRVIIPTNEDSSDFDLRLFTVINISVPK